MRKPNRQPEQALHRAVAHYLSVALTEASWFTTIGHGGSWYLRGAILKGLGLKAGVPDILIVHDGRARFLELKAPWGRTSEAQIGCGVALVRAGAAVAVARSLDEVKTALVEWDIPTRDVLLEAERHRRAA